MGFLPHPGVPKPQGGPVLRHWRFDGTDPLKNWEEKVFKGKTLFRVSSRPGGNYLHVESADACSGLFVKTEAVSGLFLRWRWRATEFPAKKKHELSNRGEDDFAARVYAIFPANNFFHSDVIEYIWDEKSSPGTCADSAYSDRIKLLVLRAGPASSEDQGWRSEHRNIYEDYLKLFGRKPHYAVGMIAVMSDSDSTGSGSAADFGEIILKRKNT